LGLLSPASSGLNTNMHLERMHGVIKHLYISEVGGRNQSLDVAINILMRFVRDMIYDCLIYLNKGKVTNKLSNIRERHGKSLSLSTEGIAYDKNV